TSRSTRTSFSRSGSTPPALGRTDEESRPAERPAASSHRLRSAGCSFSGPRRALTTIPLIAASDVREPAAGAPRGGPLKEPRGRSDHVDMTPRARSFAYTSLRALALLSIAALAAGAPPRSPWRELDLDGSPSRCRDMARGLLSSDAATWREAEMRLAHAGPAALGALLPPCLLPRTY